MNGVMVTECTCTCELASRTSPCDERAVLWAMASGPARPAWWGEARPGPVDAWFMKGLVHEIPLEERLITIEDVRELFVPHPNAVHLLYSKGGQSQANTTAKSLLEACLRMKPDRILLAELRGDECLYYVRNAASGHPGSITSCHAGSPAMAFEQMAIMIQDSPGGANLSFDVIKRLLVLTIDVVIQFQCSGGRRSISEIYFEPERKLRSA